MDEIKEMLKSIISMAVNNSKEQKEDTKKTDEVKGEKNMEIENEKVDKRDIIRQIMAIAGKEEASEDVRTIAKLAEKLAYDKSEADTADNEVADTKKGKKDDEENPKNSKEVKNEDEEDKKKVKEIKEEVKEDVENKCKNSVDNSKPDYFAKLNEIYNAATSNIKEESEYVSRADREKAAEDYFAK